MIKLTPEILYAAWLPGPVVNEMVRILENTVPVYIHKNSPVCYETRHLYDAAYSSVDCLQPYNPAAIETL
ncbi:hypothetical protein PQ472_07790 [Lacticaseibacillus pabuli]|uniref:Uncharacterized protein n=1 Tax=Lacticaseibacillus pabuli TaxID=3025672 RepID=A0ABY7WNZ5_9LACO|nr:hypothetical protein [Lacticaseibacillus sp. KACC 23028]WDF81826.1 hypothetical protein PQ472_07790 [Lacticaseibacillus sp. KACC 23028]